MKGIVIHPLRLKALSEGRLSVLRVPFREQPTVHEWQGRKFIAERAPFAPGDYFVKEAYYAPPRPLKDLLGFVIDGDIPHGRDYRIVPSVHLPEKFSRYILTIGPPVPGRLGEVTENDAVLEGFGILNTRPDYIYAPWDSNPLDEFGETWNQIYPRHPWSPDRWTWAYPVRRKR
jgi:hypothetical protein